MSVSCEGCVFPDRVLRDGPITRPEDPADFGVSVFDLKTLIIWKPKPTNSVKPWSVT
jgi:hypothetical protein